MEGIGGRFGEMLQGLGYLASHPIKGPQQMWAASHDRFLGKMLDDYKWKLQSPYGRGQIMADIITLRAGALLKSLAPAAETGGINATREGLIDISHHLSSLDADPANAIMYGRLTEAFEGGRPLTGVDANFYTHEVTESGLMNSGLSWQTAHAQTLEIQGIPYVRGYTSQLYTPEALRASEAFNNQLLIEAITH